VVSLIFVGISFRGLVGNGMFDDFLFRCFYILASNVSCYIYLLWCTKFRALIVPTKNMKIGIQRIKVN